MFSGTAREAAAGFPANVNVAAALALAGIGPDRTMIDIWADPAVDRNCHMIEVDSDSARFTLSIENIPSENPKTGKNVALSVIAALKKMHSAPRGRHLTDRRFLPFTLSPNENQRWRRRPLPSKPAKQPPYRLKDIDDEQMSPVQRSLRDAIYAGPRGIRKKLTGPFQIWLNAPELGHLAQALGAHVRYKTSLSPRLSETAILATGAVWKAQYEWFAHAPMAEKAGVIPKNIKDIQAGRPPKKAAKDELAIVDFVKEMYKTRRVSDKTYKRVHAFLGDAGTVELVGICGYYAMISMTLNVFRAQIPEDAPLPFAEPE